MKIIEGKDQSLKIYVTGRLTSYVILGKGCKVSWLMRIEGAQMLCLCKFWNDKEFSTFYILILYIDVLYTRTFLCTFCLSVVAEHPLYLIGVVGGWVVYVVAPLMEGHFHIETKPKMNQWIVISMLYYWLLLYE